ncbi:hypothetical protein D3C72_2425890 [compost metagenome]
MGGHVFVRSANIQHHVCRFPFPEQQAPVPAPVACPRMVGGQRANVQNRGFRPDGGIRAVDSDPRQVTDRLFNLAERAQ